MTLKPTRDDDMTGATDVEPRIQLQVQRSVTIEYLNRNEFAHLQEQDIVIACMM